jgi:Fic family protein
MRIPRTPPSPDAVLKNRGSELAASFSKPEFREFTRMCERRYFAWDKLRLVAPSDVDAELAWAVVKLGRIQRYRWLPLYGTNGITLRFCVPDDVQRELMLIDQQLAGRLVADDESPLHPQQRERFIITALREEAIASSMLEGAATTRRDAKQLLKSGRKPRTKGERMVWNNYRAIMFIRENNKAPLTPKLVLELHALLTTETLEDRTAEGRLRTDEDDIKVVDDRDNTIIHVPPPAATLNERLELLCRFANTLSDGELFIHPVIRACVLHFQLGFDHPFVDGNGRMARAIFYWSMLKQGYYLFEYLPISRLIYRGPSKYARAFLYCEGDEFDVTYFIRYKMRIIRQAREELRTYITAKQRQLAEARRLFADDGRLNHRQQQVVLQAVRNSDRVFTIADHRETFAVSYGTARNDLLELAEWDYLVKVGDKKRHDFYPSAKLRDVG